MLTPGKGEMEEVMSRAKIKGNIHYKYDGPIMIFMHFNSFFLKIQHRQCPGRPLEA